MHEPDEQSLSSLFSQLGDDVRERVSAEVALRKAEVSSRIAASKGGIALLAAAAVLVVAAIVAMAVGLLLIASLWIGIVWATIATVVLMLALAALLARLGSSALSSAMAGPEASS